MATNSFDVTVIGGGPGGYVAAIRAAQLGSRVLLIEKDQLGGTCLNRGCIPTKAMLADAKLYHQVKASSVINADGLRFNMAKLLERKEGVIKALRSGVGMLLKSNGITLATGKATFIDPKTIDVENDKGKERFSSGKTIIATGSVSAQLPSVAVDGKVILTSTEMLNLSAIPKDLIVIGGGYIGMEFACLFSGLGSAVTVIEMLPGVLMTEDEETARGLVTILKKRGIQIHTETRVKEAKVKNGRAEVTVVNKEGKEEVFRAEKALMAVGRSPYTDGLQLEKANVTLSGKFVKVNEKMETTSPGIYAIGDVTGRQMLAHKASAEGVAAAENAAANAAGKRATVDYSKIPNCIFTFPEIASIGLTEKQAKEKGLPLIVGRFPFVNNGRALATAGSEGLVKVIAEKELGQVVGVHILGDHATDLIGGSALALALEATTDELGKTVQAHPTLMEAVAEAALDAMHEAIHLPKKRR
ncbi:MAG: dihydrolipoyl dehydrogenase [Deltaproteobacteria bacterium]